MAIIASILNQTSSTSAEFTITGPARIITFGDFGNGGRVEIQVKDNAAGLHKFPNLVFQGDTATDVPLGADDVVVVVFVNCVSASLEIRV